MARLNKENLKKLSRKGMYEKLKTRTGSQDRIYSFKMATPEVLAAIRQKMFDQHLAIERRNIRVGLISVMIVMALVFTLSIIRF